MKKKIVTVVGLISFILGITLNFQYALGDYSIKETPLLSQFIMAQSVSEDGGLCTSRGGKEMIFDVLQREKCILEVGIGISGSAVGKGVEGAVKWGNQCSCKTPPFGYNGSKGCDLTWETGCK